MFTQYWWSSGSEANDSGVEIANSVRFRGAQFLRRAFANNWSNDITISFWIKRSTLSTSQTIVCIDTGGNNIPVRLDTNDTLRTVNGSGTEFTWDGRYRDPSAWYHVVVNNGNAWVNGERVDTGTLISNHTGQDDCTIGCYGENNSQFFSGYLADFYLIDGQILEPTAFGRELTTGQWVPREVDFTPATMRYSDFLTPTVPGTWDDGNAANVFDGLTTTFAGTGTNGTWTFAPTTDIEVGTQVRVFALNTAGTISWNGQTATPNGGWVTLTAAGNINATTPVVGTTAGTGQSSFVNAIEVDGDLLLNPFVWSGMLSASGQGDYQANQADRTLAMVNQGNAFNGNPANQTQANAGGGGWLYWNPTISANTITLLTNNQPDALPSTARINGTAVTIPTPTLIGSNNETVFTVPDGELTEFAFTNGRTTSPNTAIFGIRINGGPLLVDGVNNSYGRNGFHLEFSDVDNLGSDSSGNENDFTPNNAFNTNLPGRWSNGLEQSAAGSYIAAGGAGRSGGVNGATNAFNGNLSNQAQGPATGSWLYWTTTITCNTVQLIVNNDTDQLPANARINGTAVTVPAHTVDGSNFVVSFPVEGGTLTEFAFANGGGGPNTSIFGMRVNNGAVLVDGTGTDFDFMQDSPTRNFATLNPNQSNVGLGATAIPFVTPVDGNLQIPATSNASSNVRYPSFQIGGNQAFRFESFNPTATTGVGNPAALALVNTDTNASRNVIGDAGAVGNPPCNTAWYVDVANQVTYGWDIDTGAWINGSTGITNANINGGATQALVNWSALAASDWYIVLPDGNQGSVNISANIYNFGQQGFQSPAATGFNALQTQNLPAATIRDGREQFRALTGPGSAGGTFWAEDAGDTSDREVDRPLGTLTDPSLSGSGTFTPYPGNGSTYSWIWDAGGQVANSEFTVDFHGSTFTVRSSLDGTTWNTEADAPSGDNTITSTNAHRYVRIQAPNWGVGAGSQTMTSTSGIPILQAAQNAFDNGLYWIKDRDNNSTQHQLVDTVRGTGANIKKCPGLANTAPYAAPAGNSVAWCWSAPTEMDATTRQLGTIDVTAGRVNRAAGFSIIEYEGNTTTGATVAHGLAEAPEFIIAIAQDNTNSIPVWHHSPNGCSLLNGTGQFDLTRVRGVSNTLVTLEGNTAINDDTCSMYIWHSVPGYSAFGTYNGTGNANGPMITVGFRPAFILIKQSNNTGNFWVIYDSTRSPRNETRAQLYPNRPDDESDTVDNTIDILSTGFKPRNSNNMTNQSAREYVYAAFAQMPFGGSNTSPANAR